MIESITPCGCCSFFAPLRLACYEVQTTMASTRFPVGSVIQIHGLQSRNDLNGQPAILVRYVEESGRFQCELTSASKMVLLKPDNIMEGAVTSCHSALALSLVRFARESSQWKLKSLLNGKKLCEGCDCHLNDAKLAPCVCIAGLGASTLSGLNLPADLLASLPAELQASMNLGGASPSVGTRTICFDGGASPPVELPESAMADEDVGSRVTRCEAPQLSPWLPRESRVPFIYRRADRVCAAPLPPPAQVRMLVSSIDGGPGEGTCHAFVLILSSARREPSGTPCVHRRRNTVPLAREDPCGAPLPHSWPHRRAQRLRGGIVDGALCQRAGSHDSLLGLR